jgi:ribosomal protein L19
MDKAIADQIKPGAEVRVHEIIKEAAPAANKKGAKGKKSDGKAARVRMSVFTGIVLARKHGSEPGATFTVRAVIAGEGVEKLYPINSPLISKVEIVSSPKKIHRSKLYYLRGISPKKAREKMRAITGKASA